VPHAANAIVRTAIAALRTAAQDTGDQLGAGVAPRSRTHAFVPSMNAPTSMGAPRGDVLEPLGHVDLEGALVELAQDRVGHGLDREGFEVGQ